MHSSSGRLLGGSHGFFHEGPHGPARVACASCPTGSTGQRSMYFLLAEMQAAAEAEAFGLRENPRNSWHWDSPQEIAMMSSGCWLEFDYDACVFYGARYKPQRIRHNVDELQSLPSTCCHHLHSVDEWEPSRTSTGRVTFCRHEEAEYTAALVYTLAIATSWAAVRTGIARSKSTVSRCLIPVVTNGVGSSWIHGQLESGRCSRWQPALAYNHVSRGAQHIYQPVSWLTMSSRR